MRAIPEQTFSSSKENITPTIATELWQMHQPLCTSFVYADKPQTLDHLEDNIRRVIADRRPQMLEKVIENWTSRLDYIRASHMPYAICSHMP
ncbi:hypothetical protein TNCV_2149831 [Trichonephila clavipes]|nr:hypothetical protein TNCV_2149831 [Trichonephila clavipes]